MSGLRELVLRQKEQIEARIKALTTTTDERRKLWVDALNELKAAQEELERTNLVLKSLDEAIAKSAQPTIMQAVLEVLKHRPEGMTALEILAEINDRYFDGSIVRTSLSPQLSRLKDRDHKVTLRGNRWFLRDEQPTLLTPKR
jgi:hypothetical protein